MRISDWSSDVCSSDLARDHADRLGRADSVIHDRPRFCVRSAEAYRLDARAPTSAPGSAVPHQRGEARDRSEEHTSELQSLMRISYAVFCLKQKNTKNTHEIKKQRYNTHTH